MLRKDFENTISFDGKRVTDMIDELLDEGRYKIGLENLHFEMKNVYVRLQYGVTRTLRDMYEDAIDELHYSQNILNFYKSRKDNHLNEIESNIDELGKEIQSVKMLKLYETLV